MTILNTSELYIVKVCILQTANYISVEGGEKLKRVMREYNDDISCNNLEQSINGIELQFQKGKERAC